MKTIYTIILSLLFVHLSLGQDVLIVADDDHQDYAGTTVMITGDDNALFRQFYAKNIGTTSTFYFSRSIVNSTSQDFIIQFCDDIMCYNTTGAYWISPEKTISPGDSLLFKPQITIGSSSGTAEVRYYVLDGNKEKIDSLTVIFTSTLATDKQEKNKFNLFPNPANEVIHINGEGLNNGGAIVFLDALGKEVKRTLINNTNSEINISDLKRGVYFVKTYNQQGEKSNTLRLIKQ